MLSQSFKAIQPSELNAVINYVNGDTAKLPDLAEFHYCEGQRDLHKAITGPMAKHSYFGYTWEVFTAEQCQALGTTIPTSHVLRVTEIY